MDNTAGSGQTCELPGELVWFRATLLGEDVDLGARLRLRTIDGDCHTADAFPESTIFEVDAVDGVAINNSVRGTTEMRPLLEGHKIIAGTPRLTFTGTNTAADARVFWGLAVGTSPENALLLDAQWMPSRVELPSIGEKLSIDLGAVVADVEEGQTLYLVASSHADQFAAHASRVPGVTLLRDVVQLPLLD